MKIKLNLQNASQWANLPTRQQFKTWITTALVGAHTNCTNPELCLRLVDEQEMIMLNHTYRGKNMPTNVLSFPSSMPEDIEPNYLGDLIVCAAVMQAEADAQKKPILHHFAHLIVHGTLHLLGYDHIYKDDAKKMEALEIQILATLDIPNPYHEEMIEQ